MPAFTNAAENALIDWLFRGAPAPALPANWHFALLTQIPGDDGTPLEEVSSGAYARVPVARALVTFSGTQGPGSTAASSGAGGATSNNGLIAFAAPTADWGTVRAIGIFDAAVGGNLWFAERLAEARTVRAGDAPPSFLPGAFSFTLDAN